MTELLDTLRHEAPILLVEHDMDAVFALADRISVLVGRPRHRQWPARCDPRGPGRARRLSGG